MAENPKEATKALQKLADQITCAICLETYTEPKVLPCLHIFCKHCLERLVHQKGSSDTVKCPQCRTMTQLPSGGIVNFRSAFFVSDFIEGYNTMKKALKSSNIVCDKCPGSKAVGYCKDCGKFVCDFCLQVHTKWPELLGHTTISVTEMQNNVAEHVTLKKSAKNCEKHRDEQLKIFCETCSVVICRDCILGEHREHDYHLVSEVVQKHKAKVHTSIQPVKEQLETIATAVASVDARMKEVCERGSRVQDSIQRTVDELHGELEIRKGKLIQEVQQIVQEKTKTLTAQKDNLEILQIQAVSCLEFVDQSLQRATDAEILNMKDPILKQANEIASSFKTSRLEPIEKAHIEFFGNKELLDSCQQFGRVHAQGIFPASCYVTGEGVKTAMLGKPTEIVLHAITEDDTECTTPVESITCEIVSPNTDGSMTITRAKVVRQEKNACKLFYTPHVQGLNTLHVKIHGEDIQDSPFPLFVHNTEPITISDMKGPYGVTVMENGHMVVAENRAHRITILGKDGETLYCFGSKGVTPGKLNYPRGVAADSSGNIIVSDSDHIHKFGTDGTLIASVGTKGSGPLEFNEPRGITVDTITQKIYVADTSNHRIQVLNRDLTISHQFGGEGSKPGQLSYPYDVAIGKDSTVYVVERGNHRVQVFSADGKYLRHFGVKGTRVGQFQTPSGLCIDHNQNIYIGDKGRIYIFGSNGQFITRFSKDRVVASPYGLAIDGTGSLCISDFGNNIIKVL